MVDLSLGLFCVVCAMYTLRSVENGGLILPRYMALVVGAFYMMLGADQLSYGVTHISDDAVFAALTTGAGAFNAVAGYLIWRGGRPPRRKRRSVKEAVRRRFGRLIPIPIPVR